MKFNYFLTVYNLLMLSDYCQNSLMTNNLPKCCGSFSSVFERNSSLVCQNSTSTRFVLNSTERDMEILGNSCVDIFNSDFWIFEVQDGKMKAPKSKISSVFHKCCPLGSLYNYHNKSCDKTDLQSSFDVPFISVGLPDCRIIKDYINPTLELVDKRLDGDMGHCFDRTVRGDYVVRVCETLKVCQKTKCLRKCCGDGKSFVNGSNCRDTFEKGFHLDHFSEHIESLNDDFAIIHGYDTFVLLPFTRHFFIDAAGVFHNNATNHSYSLQDDVYCIEHATKDNIVLGYQLFRIAPKTIENKPMDLKFHFNRYAMMISGIFLVSTILYYIGSKEAKKVFGKLMVNFCLSLTVLYGVLVFFTYEGKLHYKATKTTCKAMGFFILYLTFACFIWLQVMSLDIYWTFGSPSRIETKSEKKIRDCRKIIWYSIYGWGLPLLITSISVIFYHIDVLPDYLSIEMGKTKCYLEKGDGKYAEVLFRTLPLTIIEVMNCTICLKTVRYYLKVKNEVSRLGDSNANLRNKTKFQAKRDRFGLVAKLLITMGVPYLFEVVSSFYDFRMNSITRIIEIVWDMINCLQGVFIFLIFVCKTKNFQTCRKDKALEVMRKISVSSSVTRSTSLPATLNLRKISFDRWKKPRMEQSGSLESQ